MATSSTRTITVAYTGDFSDPGQTLSAAANGASPGMVEIRTLANGDNTITVPTGGSTPTAVTIVPPTGNANLIKIKGVGGDTGVGIHKTDPTSLGLDSTVTTFVLNAAAQVTGVRLFWH